MTTEQLPPIEIETGSNPRFAVIWMHGLGADGNDFVPIVDELALPPGPIRFVFPHAPLQPVTINGGYVMRAWYDIGYQDLALKEDEKGVRESQRTIEQLIEREIGRGIPAGRVALAGSLREAPSLADRPTPSSQAGGCAGTVHLSSAAGQVGVRAQ